MFQPHAKSSRIEALEDFRDSNVWELPAMEEAQSAPEVWLTEEGTSAPSSRDKLSRYAGKYLIRVEVVSHEETASIIVRSRTIDDGKTFRSTLPARVSVHSCSTPYVDHYEHRDLKLTNVETQSFDKPTLTKEEVRDGVVMLSETAKFQAMRLVAYPAPLKILCGFVVDREEVKNTLLRSLGDRLERLHQNSFFAHSGLEWPLTLSASAKSGQFDPIYAQSECTASLAVDEPPFAEVASKVPDDNVSNDKMRYGGEVRIKAADMKLHLQAYVLGKPPRAQRADIPTFTGRESIAGYVYCNVLPPMTTSEQSMLLVVTCSSLYFLADYNFEGSGTDVGEILSPQYVCSLDDLSQVHVSYGLQAVRVVFRQLHFLLLFREAVLTLKFLSLIYAAAREMHKPDIKVCSYPIPSAAQRLMEPQEVVHAYVAVFHRLEDPELFSMRSCSRSRASTPRSSVSSRQFASANSMHMLEPFPLRGLPDSSGFVPCSIVVTNRRLVVVAENNMNWPNMQRDDDYLQLVLESPLYVVKYAELCRPNSDTPLLFNLVMEGEAMSEERNEFACQHPDTLRFLMKNISQFYCQMMGVPLRLQEMGPREAASSRQQETMNRRGSMKGTAVLRAGMSGAKSGVKMMRSFFRRKK